MSFGNKLQPPAMWKKAASTSIIPIPAVATIRSCNNDDEPEIAASARIPKPNSATTVATIRSKSPRKIQTQTAKLVYNPSTSTMQSNRDNVNETEKSVHSAAEIEEFQKKRQDRDREVKEIHEMLNEFTKSPTKQKKDTADEEPQKAAKNSPPKQPTNTIQRSKTDTNLRRPTARKTQVRQESQTQTARCKSAHIEEKNSPPKQRQKTYSSEEAQRYMQEQRKKRRSLQMSMPGVQSAKAGIDKDEIKRRLEDLRQNTRKIVDKNVKIAKRKAGTLEENHIPLRREETTNRMNKESGVLLKNAGPENVSKPPEVRQDPSPLAENYKKVGLLRKPELKDHSFSALKNMDMDKENRIADILTPQLLELVTSRLGADGETSSSKVISPQILEHPVPKLDNNKNVEEKRPESNLYGKAYKKRSSPELDLQVPEVKLRSHVSMREKSVQADSTALGSSRNPKQNAEIPFWLKPTSVQAYPYNFIMAVRKKLEAIANPPAVASSSISSLEPQASKKHPTETPVSYSKPNRSNNVKRRIIDTEIDKSLAKSAEKSSSNKENIGDHRLSRSFSEVTSNFSSISIKLPDSNKTVSEPKLKPEQNDEDATTVSSSVFSSPEKKNNHTARSKNSHPEALSPLSMDNISNLHIKSKAMMSNITLERGDDFKRTSSRNIAGSGSMSNRSEASVDFSQLLDDFNRSLSQVIEVNQQLKTTLVKSQIFSPEKRSTSVLKTNRVELTEYKSDFEESSNVHEKSEISNQSHRTQSRKSSIHENQESSKPSTGITTQKSSSVSSFSREEILEEESQSSFKNLQTRSTNPSPLSIGAQTFVVSSEEKEQSSTRTETIHEEVIEESPSKENMSMNQYSLDSLETSQHENEYIKNHINTSRGDYEQIEFSAYPPPPSYKVSSESQPRSSPNVINSSVDSEFVRIFNKSDMEISVLSLNRSLSESTVNYSSIGMYEKLIQNETNKSEHLAALLKMREKALIDRTKGQIAWLEVQKERYKSKGLVMQISAVKKKQRGILLKMEKEREEIKKLLQRAKIQRDDNKLRIPEIRPFSDVSLIQHRRASGIQVLPTSHQKHQHKSHQQQLTSTRSKSSTAIIRGYELETSRSLEQLLQKREEDLRRRREHVERLMEWHRRLDQEEAEVLQLERILLDYNNVHGDQQQQQQNEVVAVPERTSKQTKMQKKLRDIDRSLQELSSISVADGSTDRGVGSGEFVRTSGTKLNKLWRRLTSQRIEKFQPNKKYKLCKTDIEQLYEDAKLAVLDDFGENAGQMEEFLGQTSIASTTQPSNVSMDIPQLNLNFSSGQSEEDIIRGNYSPSAAEEGFVAPSSLIRDGFSDECSSKRRTTSQSSSLSAIQSLSECSSDKKRIESAEKSEGRPNKSLSENFRNTSSDLDSKSGFSTESANVSTLCSMNHNLSCESQKQSKNNSKDSQTSKKDNVTGDSNTNSNRLSSIEIGRSMPNNYTVSNTDIFETSSQSRSLAAGSTDKQSRSIKSIESIKNSVPDLTHSSGSYATIKSSETGRNQVQKTTIHSLSDFSKGSIEEISVSPNIGTNYSNTNSKTIDRLDSTKTQLSSESISPEGKLQNQFGDSSGTRNRDSSEMRLTKSKTNDESVSSVSSMANKSSSESVPSTQTKLSQSASNVQTILTESPKSSSKSCSIERKTITSAPSLKLNSSKDTSDLPDFKTKIDYEPTELQSVTGLECAKTGTSNQTSSNHQVIAKDAAMDGSPKSSSEDCATVSILKSLLNSTYNNNSSAANDIQAQLRVSGHDFQDWTNSLIQEKENPPSFNNEQSKSESLSLPDEATLRSIKSIDNSTNSKHSAVEPVSNPPTIMASEEDDIHSNQMDNSISGEDNHQSYSSAFEKSVSSNQIRSSVIMSIKSSPFQVEVQSELNTTSAFYESDFTEGEETNIDDISLPKFETTAEEEQFHELQQLHSPVNTTDFEKRLIDLDVSLKGLDATFEKALSPEKSPSPSRDDEGKINQQQNDSALMPDIISEVELRRRHQAMLENELKQFEHAVPYMYVREIPNKPPPPYVPPAHGSPMTTIFPSEERIKDITFRRTKELYHEILNLDTKDENGKKPPSVLDENITNIYERIILDICKEYLTEYKPVLTSSDPNNFHSPLAFFNPPDRLRCMQEFIYKEVRKNLAMDKNTQEKSHRGKRDHVGEIIIQEMYEEDNSWSNFYVEEQEVLELILEEIINTTVKDFIIKALEDEIPRELITSTQTDADEKNVEMSCKNST